MSRSSKAIFVAGAHTDVGKTFAACSLITAARAQGLSVAAFKPVVSGFDPLDWRESDPGRLLSALGLPLSLDTLSAISPLRYRAALAPPMAARRESESLWLADLVVSCRGALAADTSDVMLIEGAGGVMSPIAEDATNLDLMAALGLPVLLVGGSYLGAISHTLTALDCVRSRGLAVTTVLVSESADEGAPDHDETVESVMKFAGGVRVAGAKRGDATGWLEAGLPPPFSS